MNHIRRALAAILAALFIAVALPTAAHAAPPALPTAICSLCGPGVTDDPESNPLRPPPPPAQGTNGMVEMPSQAPVTKENSERACNFIRGCRNEDDLNPSEYKLHYAEKIELLEIPGKGKENDLDVSALDSANWFGMMADGQFEEYKTIIDATLTFIGVAVFGLYIVAVLAEPALALGETFRVNVAEPAELSLLVLAMVAIAMIGATLRGRYSHALTIALASSTILALAALIDPSDVARYLVSTAVAGATLMLLGAAGEDVSGIPGPSTGQIDTTQLLDAYSRFRSGIEEHMIAIPAQVLTFGGVLPDQCQAAYKEMRELNLPAGDHRAFQPLLEANCWGQVENAMQADAERWFFALLLAIYALIFIVVYAIICWPALKGQAILIIGLAASPFLLLGAALPGNSRGWAIRILVNLVLGTLALISLSIQLAIILMGMSAVMLAGDSLAFYWRLIIALAIPVAFIFVNRAIEKKTRNTARKITAKVTKPHVPARNDGRGFVPVAMHRATRKAQTAAIGAAGGAGLAVIHGAVKAAQAAKDGMYGNEKHAGLLYGKHGVKPGKQSKDESTPHDTATEKTTDPTSPTTNTTTDAKKPDTANNTAAKKPTSSPTVDRSRFREGLAEGYAARAGAAAYRKAAEQLHARTKQEAAKNAASEQPMSADK